MKKRFKFLIILLVLLIIVFCFFFLGKAPEQENIVWGISFSQKHAQNLELDWQEAYLAILDDLKIKNLRLITYWDMIELGQGQYNFQDLDWQIEQAEERNIKIILVIGMKTPRWPECHIPDWLENQGLGIKNKELLEYLEIIVNRYKDREVVWAWQIENEPFFEFGECPEIDEDFIKQEIDLVGRLDPQRKIIITESGTGSFWFRGARLGDIVGISLYRKVWFHKPKIYVNYFSPAVFYWRKAQIIKYLFNKQIICTELQAEPWGPVLLYDLSLEEQKKTMDLEQFNQNIEFAEKTGLNEFYLWGAEWWYWMKTKNNNSEIWNKAKNLIILKSARQLI